MEVEEVKVELGGGENPRKEGFVNVDILDDDKVDIKCDFEQERLPFEDDEVDEIYSHHCLEHIGDVQWFMNECWRVLKKDGVAEFTVPYGLWEGAQKPVHKQCITESWFNFFRRGGVWKVYGYREWDLFDGFDIVNDNFGVKCELTVRMKPRK